MKHILRSSFLILLIVTLMAVLQPAPSLAGHDVRVMIEFLPGRGAAVRAAVEGAGGRVHYDFERVNVLAVSLPEAALRGIQRNPNVLSIVQDAPRYPMAMESDQTTPWGIDAVQARDVWDVDRDDIIDAEAPIGTGITVCIIDSGINVNHDDFADVNILGGSPDGWNEDFCGHGTHVAGTITAQHNDLGVVGVSPGAVSLYIVKVFGDDCSWAYSSTLMAATEECVAAGANIISMSLGGEKSLRPEQRQFDALYDMDILSIAAAGNDGNTLYSYPASYDSVVSVAAIAESLAVADFSQQNDQVELAAPGVDVLSTVPWVATDELTVDGVTYSAFHIENAAYGTATGLLVDGGLCTAAGDWDGAVVLCERGEISFYDKVMSVEDGGGVAAVIYNNEPGNFYGTLDERNSSEIVAISLSQADGQYLVAEKLGLVGAVSSALSIPDSGYEAWEGTSMATPHVSGVAALLWSTNPALTNDQVRQAMAQTTLDLGAEGRDVTYGYGLVQAADALAALDQGAEGLVLTATTAREKGQKLVTLTWTGATVSTVRVYRNGTYLADVQNAATFTDDTLGPKDRGTYAYQVCEAGSDVCSNVVSVTF